MLTEEKVFEILERLKNTTHAIKIVLFGSWAWGVPREDSDIDVLVVEDKYTDKRKELVKIKSKLISSSYSLDILLFSREEYEKKRSEGWSILDKIEKSGKVYYAA